MAESGFNDDTYLIKYKECLKNHDASIGEGGVTPRIIAFGGNGGDSAAESSSEDLNMFESSDGGHAVIQPSMSGSKKMFSTKYSQKQKDRMQEFAATLDWRIQKQEDEELQRFCSEVGVKIRTRTVITGTCINPGGPVLEFVD